ncbi:hypothetical protein LRP50_21910 [Enterovibrio sp. ZSDZ42]|uniref:Uncharacterized protein n=1 Tax=Enterovibrio gelatinilyticus TaxID=2899819 RepID=A0ABT5R6E6_9GAMM|nr:hypothetical protein [Enterovibrio sp. ZSDZ42]MDD1795780.1 hypothetical protein [Enterovibrio sp. ZSDZ42]
MDKSVGNNEYIKLEEREEICDEIDALMDLMLVEGELSDGTKVWIRRTLIRLVKTLDLERS